MESAIARLEGAVASQVDRSTGDPKAEARANALRAENAALRDTAHSLAKRMDGTINQIKTLVED